LLLLLLLLMAVLLALPRCWRSIAWALNNACRLLLRMFQGRQRLTT
jgi:hypothetical protein